MAEMIPNFILKFFGRKRIMKKIISLALSLALMVSGTLVFAADNLETNKEEKAEESAKTLKTYTLSLDEAVKMAFTDNLQLAAVEFKKQSNEISLKGAKETKASLKHTTDAAGKLGIGLTASSQTALVRQGYYVDLYSSQADLAKDELVQVKNKISYDVTEKYYNYKLAERLLEVYKNSEELAKANYETIKKQYELGAAAKVDLESAEAGVKQAEASAEAFARNLELSAESLAISLNVDYPCNFVLTDGLSFVPFESDLEKDIKQAEEKRYDIKALKENERLSESYYTIVKNTFTDASADAATAKSTYLQAKYTTENGIKNIKLGIKNTYNSVLSAAKDIEIAEINVDICKQKHEAGRLKYEMGMITDSELTSLMNDYITAEVNLEKAKLSYKLATSKYGYEITEGISN